MHIAILAGYFKATCYVNATHLCYKQHAIAYQIAFGGFTLFGIH